MKIRKMQRIVVVILALLLIGIQPTTILAQDAGTKGTWDDVRAIPFGEKLEIKLKSVRTEKGTLTAVSETGISMTSGTTTINIDRDNVRQLYRVAGSSSKKSAVVGAVAGAATVGAFGLGSMAARDAGWDDGNGLIFGLLVAAGAGAGALIGHVIGKNRTRKVLVYQSQ